MKRKPNNKWPKWLLAGTIAFISIVAYTHQDEVGMCLLDNGPTCTVLHKSQDRMTQENE